VSSSNVRQRRLHSISRLLIRNMCRF
jgi:hypothetical protein